MRSFRFLLSVWLPAAGITVLSLRHAAWGKLGLQDSVMEHNRHNTSITVGTYSISKLQWCSHSKRHLLLTPLFCLTESWHETSVFYNRSKSTNRKNHLHLGLTRTSSFQQRLHCQWRFPVPINSLNSQVANNWGKNFLRLFWGCLQI